MSNASETSSARAFKRCAYARFSVEASEDKVFMLMLIKVIGTHVTYANFDTLGLEHYTSALLSKALMFQIH